MEIHLKQGELLGVDPDPAGVTVQCRDGMLWLTQAGDRRDHLLHGGERYHVDRPGRVVLTALRATRLTLVEPLEQRATAAWRFQQVTERGGRG